jgi:hypothetical protein
MGTRCYKSEGSGRFVPWIRSARRVRRQFNYLSVVFIFAGLLIGFLGAPPDEKHLFWVPTATGIMTALAGIGMMILVY